ncbi:MAG: DUF3124 domain-containing protein [Chloroflexota bacterium]|nr:DUF3124 domain-containing protein [Chloroflexota bacterium]
MSAKSKMVKLTIFILATLLTAGFLAGPSQASEVLNLSQGQTVYVPLYSNIFVGDRQLNWALSALLSIRNTDPSNPITVSVADYYDTNGKLVRKYLSKPDQLNPLGSTYYYVKTSDTTGGWGANFIVQWNSEKEVSEPIIQSIMIGTRGTHSVSFITQGRIIAK